MTRHLRAGGEEGSISIWLVTTGFAMIVLVGLGVDLGGQVYAQQHARAVADQAARTGGNQRRYPRAILRRVAFIKVAQRVGIPLAEIAEALQALPAGRTPIAADWRRLSREWRAGLDERIRTLTQLRNQLDGCIGCGCLSLKACPLRNAQDALSQEGPGPHFEDEPQ